MEAEIGEPATVWTVKMTTRNTVHDRVSHPRTLDCPDTPPLFPNLVPWPGPPGSTLLRACGPTWRPNWHWSMGNLDSKLASDDNHDAVTHVGGGFAGLTRHEPATLN